MAISTFAIYAWDWESCTYSTASSSTTHSANVDVMHDAAFPAMELTAAGREDGSVHFLNAYLERTGDWHGAQLLPLYLCRQAYVRAKVNSLLQEEHEISASERQTAQQAARDYYKLACSCAAPRPRGNLTVVCGMSGSGKSTVARRLAGETRAIHIRSDALRKHIARVPLDAARGCDACIRRRCRPERIPAWRNWGCCSPTWDSTWCSTRRTIVVRAERSCGNLRQDTASSWSLYSATHRFHSAGSACWARARDLSDATADLLDRQQAEFEDFRRSGVEHHENDRYNGDAAGPAGDGADMGRVLVMVDRCGAAVARSQSPS